MDIKTEIVIYLFTAGLLSAARRVISGAKNGAFYAKGKVPLPNGVAKYVYNLHYLETPAWYAQFISQFLLCLAIYRLFDIDTTLHTYLWSCTAAYLTTMGCSSMAGMFYQGYINLGSGKEFIDEDENPKSEFAFWKWKFWWPRPWYGKRRVYASILGLITLLAGIYLGVYR